MNLLFRTWATVVLLSAVTSAVHANPQVAKDIARIHVEAIGGHERLARLSALRAGGESKVGGQEMEFQMWAKRPNAVRIEIEAQGLLLTQAWSGDGEPWMRAGEKADARLMPRALADAFKTEADFDDPLYQSEERGFVLEYAGEDEVGQRPVVKLLATRSATEQSILFLAADTYFIVRQDRVQLRPDGTRTETQTFYGDFRPVQGVILPHKIVVWSGEELVSETVLGWMEANPPIEADLFTMPR